MSDFICLHLTVKNEVLHYTPGALHFSSYYTKLEKDILITGKM